MNSETDISVDIARGDRGLSSHLKACMQLLAERSQDAEFKAAIADAVAGKRSLRDLVGSDSFERVLRPLVDSFAEQYRELSDTDREAMAVEGQRQLDRLGATSPNLESADVDESYGSRGVLSSDW
ncbi:hypothetical protein [Rhodococcus oryzae]|uniref:hypothetical protein n=1 Tax=Rhodococcus oryzae TaxID=2571143 RepID=UPI0037BAD7A0